MSRCRGRSTARRTAPLGEDHQRRRALWTAPTCRPERQGIGATEGGGGAAAIVSPVQHDGRHDSQALAGSSDQSRPSAPVDLVGVLAMKRQATRRVAEWQPPVVSGRKAECRAGAHRPHGEDLPDLRLSDALFSNSRRSPMVAAISRARPRRDHEDRPPPSLGQPRVEDRETSVQPDDSPEQDQFGPTDAITPHHIRPSDPDAGLSRDARRPVQFTVSAGSRDPAHLNPRSAGRSPPTRAALVWRQLSGKTHVPGPPHRVSDRGRGVDPRRCWPSPSNKATGR
jgi:hypothetical protein